MRNNYRFDNFLEEYQEINNQFTQLALKHNFSQKEIGYVSGRAIWLMESKRFDKQPRVLIASGLHGTEKAGPWGVVYFLENYYQEFKGNINLSFLPLINPTGFILGTENNDWDENPNRGYCHQDETGRYPSKEGRILLENQDLLVDLAKNGFIALHEDLDFVTFYYYTFNENHPNYPKLNHRLRKVLSQYFNPAVENDIYGAAVFDAVIPDNHDGSLEDLMFHHGIPFSACTETPGKLEKAKRVEANGMIIKTFCEHVIECYS